MRQTVSTSVESAGGRSVSRRQTTGSDGLGCNGGPQAAKATVATASLLSIALGTRDAHCALYALEGRVDLGIAMRGGQERGLEW